MVYFGCASAAGKLRWGFTVALLILGAVLLTLFQVEWSGCRSCEKYGGAYLCRSVTSDDLVHNDGELKTCSMSKVRGCLGGCVVALCLSIVACITFFFAKAPQDHHVYGLEMQRSAERTKSGTHLAASDDEHVVPAAVFLAVPRMEADSGVSRFKVSENLIAEQ